MPPEASVADALLDLYVPPIGRAHALAQIKELASVASVVVVEGVRAVGKTTLVEALAADLEAKPAWVNLGPGDSVRSVEARAARVMRVPPGQLAAELANNPRMLVLDDVGHLSEVELHELVAELAPGPTGLGRVIVIGGDAGLAERVVGAAVLVLEGLDREGALALWQALPGQVPVPAGLLARTRGMPLAIRQAWADASVDGEAWALPALTASTRAVLEWLAVLGRPIALPSLASLSGQAAPMVAQALAELVRRQWIARDVDARWRCSSVARDRVIGALSPAARTDLERGCASWWRGASAHLGDGVPAMSRGEVTRAIVLHELAAGDHAAAVAEALRAPAQVELGSIAEHEAMIASIGVGADPRLAERLIELAWADGRIAETAHRVAQSGRGGAALRARLALASGDVVRANPTLEAAVRGAPELRAELALLALLRGDPAAAEAILPTVDAADATLDDVAAHAELARYRGEPEDARRLLTRAHARALADGAGDQARDVEFLARIAVCLTREGRLREAARTLARADAAAIGRGGARTRDELDQARAELEARAGAFGDAVGRLERLVERRRQRGDELAAMRSELALAEVLIRIGEVSKASELALALAATATRAGLAHVQARAHLVLAAGDLQLAEFDRGRARVALATAGGHLDHRNALRGRALAAELAAAGGKRAEAAALLAELPIGGLFDEVDRGMVGLRVALLAGDAAAALDQASDLASIAERLGRGAELAETTLVIARIELARGEHGRSRAAATRAVREAVQAGLVRVRVHALLALAALTRDEGGWESALVYARDAAELSSSAGLAIERLVAGAALDGLSAGAVAIDPAAAPAAALSPGALAAGARLLADLGLTATRPYRVIDAHGVESDIADADPEILRMATRTLAVDAVRESIWRQGQELADLRRRSLLKKLLFMFAAAPGQSFGKEEIVRQVWNVEYHPLRHDAALFTNIMRIRRLLGEDGAELIRGSEDGYRFVPPEDYIFVQLR